MESMAAGRFGINGQWQILSFSIGQGIESIIDAAVYRINLRFGSTRSYPFFEVFSNFVSSGLLIIQNQGGFIRSGR